MCLDKAGWEGKGGQGPSSYALLRYLACPEGNGEPLKGVEQGIDVGLVSIHEDLLVSLLPGYGQTAGRSSQSGAAAPSNSSSPPHPPGVPASLQATCVFPLSPRALGLLTRKKTQSQILGVPQAAATGNEPCELWPRAALPSSRQFKAPKHKSDMQPPDFPPCSNAVKLNSSWISLCAKWGKRAQSNTLLVFALNTPRKKGLQA